MLQSWKVSIVVWLVRAVLPSRAFIGTAVLFLSTHSLSAFLPCLLINPRLQIERAFLSSSPIIKKALKESTAAFQHTIATSNDPDFGTTTPNTTVFLISLFSTGPDERIRRYRHSERTPSKSTIPRLGPPLLDDRVWAHGNRKSTLIIDLATWDALLTPPYWKTITIP